MSEATNKEVADDLELNPRCVREYRESSRALLSSDSPVGSEDSTPISECVADENAAAPFDELVRENDINLLLQALVLATDFHKRILAETPLGRIGQTEDIGKVAAFLASDDAGWISGETLLVAGGQR